MEYDALSLLGINRNVKWEWQNIPRANGGIGLLSLKVEQTIRWINLILQHYSINSTLGLKCRASLEALQLEVGCLENSLYETYHAVG